jgi:hypothetical protein
MYVLYSRRAKRLVQAVIRPTPAPARQPVVRGDRRSAAGGGGVAAGPAGRPRVGTGLGLRGAETCPGGTPGRPPPARPGPRAWWRTPGRGWGSGCTCRQVRTSPWARSRPSRRATIRSAHILPHARIAPSVGGCLTRDVTSIRETNRSEPRERRDTRARGQPRHGPSGEL